jgi:hypothetical protein
LFEVSTSITDNVTGKHGLNCKRMPRYRARHWIVERTQSWTSSPGEGLAKDGDRKEWFTFKKKDGKFGFLKNIMT